MPPAHICNCIIVDDDEIDRLTTLSFAIKYSFLNISGVYDNAADAFLSIKENAPDVLLLDIDLGEISGLEMRRNLLHIPACIFITSYPDYALDGFDLSALDFLIKPLSHERFEISMKRLQDFLLLRKKSELLDHSLNGDTIFIKDGHDQLKINMADILYLEALKDYTKIVTTTKKHAVLASLGNLLKDKSFQSFVRVHRSYAVQKHFIQKVSSHEVFIGAVRIPVGRKYKDVLLALSR